MHCGYENYIAHGTRDSCIASTSLPVHEAMEEILQNVNAFDLTTILVVPTYPSPCSQIFPKADIAVPRGQGSNILHDRLHEGHELMKHLIQTTRPV